MPLTIQVIVPASETTATLVSLGGTGTAANPYTITPISGTKLGTIEVADVANLLGAWSWNVGTRAFGRVNIVAGTSSYPLLSAQEASTAAIAAYDPPTRTEATSDKDEVIAAVEAIETDTQNIQTRLPAALVDGRIDSNVSRIGNAPVMIDSGTEGAISFRTNAYISVQGDTVDANIVQVGGEDIHDDGDGRMEVVGGGGGGAIEGDNEIAVTITDSDTDEPIEGAKIRYYRTGQAGGGTATVGVDGEVIVGLNSATWKWIASAAGYESKTGTLVVSADRTHAIELDAVVVTVADAPYCNVVLPILDQYLAPASDVLVCIEFLSFLPNATKTAVIINHPPSLLSDGGQVQVTLARLAKYRATYQIPGESPKRIEFSTPNAGSFVVVEA